MVYGADPNVGRILMAVGKCFDCTIDPRATSAWINGHEVVRDGYRLEFDDAVVRTALGSEVVDIVVVAGRRKRRGDRVRLRPHAGLHRRERGVLLELRTAVVGGGSRVVSDG